MELRGRTLDLKGLTAEEGDRVMSLTAGLLDVLDECEAKSVGDPARSEAKGSPGELVDSVASPLNRLFAGFRRVADERDRLRAAAEHLQLSIAASAVHRRVTRSSQRMAEVLRGDPASLPRSEWPVEEFDASKHERPPKPELSVVLDPAEVLEVSRAPHGTGARRCSVAQPCELCRRGDGSCCAWAAGDGAA